MLVSADGSVRYFTVRELARLQTFPDWFIIPHVWSTAVKQLGNAMPVALAEVFAHAFATTLRQTAVSTKAAPDHATPALGKS